MAHDRFNTCKSASPCSRCKGWQSRHGSLKRGLNTKLHVAVDAHGMPLKIIITKGTRADCTQAAELIENIKPEHLIADRGYDSNATVKMALSRKAKAVIPPKRNRKIQR